MTETMTDSTTSDGTYDDAAVAKVRRAFRSKGDDGEGKASLRLIEVLSSLQQSSGVRPLTLMSGYRSPDYNDGLIANGKRAASGSLPRRLLWRAEMML